MEAYPFWLKHSNKQKTFKCDETNEDHNNVKAYPTIVSAEVKNFCFCFHFKQTRMTLQVCEANKCQNRVCHTQSDFSNFNFHLFFSDATMFKNNEMG
jgi:hypothetical protein